MIRPGDAYPPDREGDPLADSLHELSRPVSAPDMTRRIMGRLGYMQVSPAVARRARRRRWARRGLLGAAFAATMFVGLEVRQQGPEIRRPTAPTVPGAIGTDLQQHQERFSRTIQLIRGLTPSTPAAAPAGSEEGATTPEPEAEQEAPALDETIDRSGLGPVRWV
jgi:hypothetical protein